MISGDALVTDEFWKITGKPGEGTRMTFAPDPRRSPDAKDVVAQFKAKNYDPEGYTLYTYAAVQAWADAATKAKSIKTADVAKALRGNKYKTVIGTLDFNDKGDIVNPQYVFYEWKDGKYAEIGSGT
ncbi:Uncharacterized protein APZ42_003116 [Daphnia magna]|nr:Uncharacterized protein APZ42_003116 [Daphnia magna]